MRQTIVLRPQFVQIGSSKKPGSVWNCLWGHALKIYPEINCKSGVLYPGPGLLSSASWHSLLEKKLD